MSVGICVPVCRFANLSVLSASLCRNINYFLAHHLLGNVAHDLRTPLQAFLSEVEILRGNIENHTASEQSNVLLESIKQLDLIGVFMNMTINRSIDFTKSSSGIKLNPSIESINFSETLDWAVGCMMKSHTNVPIVIAPIAQNICN